MLEVDPCKIRTRGPKRNLDGGEILFLQITFNSQRQLNSISLFIKLDAYKLLCCTFTILFHPVVSHVFVTDAWCVPPCVQGVGQASCSKTRGVATDLVRGS